VSSRRKLVVGAAALAVVATWLEFVRRSAHRLRRANIALRAARCLEQLQINRRPKDSSASTCNRAPLRVIRVLEGHTSAKRTHGSPDEHAPRP
jgi:hypothetical protein